MLARRVRVLRDQRLSLPVLAAWSLLACSPAGRPAATGILGGANASGPQHAAPALDYQRRDLTFVSEGIPLSASLYSPVSKSRYPVVVMVSGSGLESTIGDEYTRTLASAFAKGGIGLLAYDKRGTGKSGGGFTGGDFEALGRDAAAALRFAHSLDSVDSVGIWGISQAGWVIPYALRQTREAAFAILVSPAGVNPHEQVTFFLHQQMRALGLSEPDAEKADRMHRATLEYYASGRGYEAAQGVVDEYRNEPWFHRVVTHPYWDDMSSEGRLLCPTELAEAVARKPGEFELARSPSSFVDYGAMYEALTIPTLVIYGDADALVPILRSRRVIEGGVHQGGNTQIEFRTFEGADHDIKTPQQEIRADYLDLLVSWSKRQLRATGR